MSVIQKKKKKSHQLFIPMVKNEFMGGYEKAE